MPRALAALQADTLRPAGRARATCLLVALCLVIWPGAGRAQDPAPGVAQERPQEPGAGLPATAELASAPRLSVAADVSITFGPHDPYWFNYTDYDQNALRFLVASLGGSYRLARWLDGVAEVRVENADRVRASALYARVTPWRDRAITFSAGRVPPVFGAFAGTRYGSDNPLISRPLPYQYLTTLRYDVVPISADSLLAVRGDGWRVRYPESRGPNPIVPANARAGVPFLSTSRWDTGILAHVESDHVEIAGGVTVGTLADPRVDDNNGGKQVAARAVWRPDAAWSVGVSVARGAFVSRAAAVQAGSGDTTWPQWGVGLDAAFSRGYLGLRGEVLFGGWRIPEVTSPVVDGPLGTTGAILEARYRVLPRLDVAARADWLGFSEISGTMYGGVPTPWDAEVTRVEAGLTYRVSRHWRVKAVYQHDWRYGAERESEGYPAVQLVVWY